MNCLVSQKILQKRLCDTNSLDHSIKILMLIVNFPPIHIYILLDEKNEYLQALQNIGNILRHYDSDQRIPVYGFGAKLPPQYNVVSHCFSLNNNYFDPEIEGLDQVIESK